MAVRLEKSTVFSVTLSERVLEDESVLNQIVTLRGVDAHSTETVEMRVHADEALKLAHLIIAEVD